MSKLIVANLKMHFSPAEAQVYVEHLLADLSGVGGAEVVLCPPAIDLFPLAERLKDSPLKLGAQNVYCEDEGAFTGETAAAMLKGLADYVIVGHSERRQIFHEDDKLIAKKVAAVIRHDLVPILCVGENLLQREQGHSTRVVTGQLEANLAELTTTEAKKVVIAYEPIWAIGNDNFAKPDEVTPVVRAIQDTMRNLFDLEVSRLLYGGSVAADNAKAYLNLSGIDGLLVGHSSLNHAKFAMIVKAVS